MATQESCTTILVLHPVSAPSVVNTDSALEFEEEGALVLPVQKQLKDALVQALNEYASCRKIAATCIKSCLRVDAGSNVEFPASYVLRLSGTDITSAEVNVFKAAARFVLAKLIPQQELGEPQTEHLLGEKDKHVLRSLGEDVAARFAGKSVRQGIVIKFGSTDSQGIKLQGVMPALAIDHSSSGAVIGIARPLGLDEEKSTVTLLVEKPADGDRNTDCDRRVEGLCHDLKFLRIAAQVYANCGRVKFKAIIQPEARKKKRLVITLLELREIEANEVDQFELE